MQKSRTNKNTRLRKRTKSKSKTKNKSKFFMTSTRRQSSLKRETERNTGALVTSITRRLPSIRYVSPSSTKMKHFPVYPIDRSLFDRYKQQDSLVKSAKIEDDLLYKISYEKDKLRMKQKTGSASANRLEIKKLRSRLQNEVRKTDRALKLLSKQTSKKNAFLRLRKPGLITNKISLTNKFLNQMYTKKNINILTEKYQLLNFKFIEYIYRDICESLNDYVLFMVYIDKNSEITVIQQSESGKQSVSFKQKQLKLNKPFSSFLLGFRLFIHPENEYAIHQYSNYPGLTDITFTSSQRAFDFFLENSRGYHLAGHTNLILIDNTHKTIERFDPLGKELIADSDAKGMFGTLDVPFESAIKGIFENIQGYKYISTLEFCPQISFQLLQPGENISRLMRDPGYCSYWSMYFLEMRLLNRNMSTDILVENMFTDFRSVGKDKMSVYMTMTILLYVICAFSAIKELDKKRTITINDTVLDNVYKKLYGEQGRMDYTVDIHDGRNKIYDLKKIISEIEDYDFAEDISVKKLRI